MPAKLTRRKGFSKLEVNLADALWDVMETFGLEELIDTEEQATALQRAKDVLGEMT